MDDVRTLKEIYKCSTIVSDEKLYPLQKWYNQLIDKSINEITVEDVLKMIRQKEFVDIAMARAMIFLKENVFVGELYDGEMLENVSQMDNSFYASHIGDLQIITKSALEKCDIHEWSYDGEADEFVDIVNTIIKKMS